MTSRAVAAVAVRIIGLWLLVETALAVVSLFLVHRDLLAGTPGVHKRYYGGGTAAVSSDLYLHDTYYVMAHFYPVWDVAARLVGGVVLIIASKPIARVITRGLDNF